MNIQAKQSMLALKISKQTVRKLFERRGQWSTSYVLYIHTSVHQSVRYASDFLQQRRQTTRLYYLDHSGLFNMTVQTDVSHIKPLAAATTERLAGRNVGGIHARLVLESYKPMRLLQRVLDRPPGLVWRSGPRVTRHAPRTVGPLLTSLFALLVTVLD
jgi:hypothetical protein